MNNYNQNTNSSIKNLSRILPLIAASTVKEGITSLSLPASCGIYEQAIKDLGGEVYMMESKPLVYKSNRGKMSKIGAYKKGVLQYIGHKDFSPNVVWADYCGLPSIENMQIGEGVKIAFATFAIGGRPYSKRATKNNNFAYCCLLHRDIEDKIKRIKRHYVINFKNYELITCIRYVSGTTPMLLIGFAHKSVKFPSKLKEIQSDLSFNYSEKSLGESFIKTNSFIARVSRKAARVGIDVEKYLPKKIDNKEENGKVINMAKTKITKDETLKEITKVLYASKKFTDEQIIETLGITKMKLAGTKAAYSRYYK